MILCPNLKNPEVARVFDELKLATSELAAYHIWSLNNGNAIDKAPNGAESKLFLTLLDHYNGDRTKAIQAKAKTYGNSFLTWFGDWINDAENASKVVDENGEPLMVYRIDVSDFTVFDKNHLEDTRPGFFGRGFYFSNDLENVRKSYSEPGRDARAFFLNMKDYDLHHYDEPELYGEMSKDRIITFEHADDDFYKEYIVKNPNQIKSATDNQGPTPYEGTYSRENDDIYLSIDNVDNRGNRNVSITNQLISHLKSIGIKVRNRRDMIKYLREHGLAGLLKFIGRKARTKFEQQLLRARPDMTNDEIKATLDFLHSLEDNKENTAYIKTAVRWVANRSITLPQDNTKARQAFDLARKKHIDLQKYDTLGDLIASDEMKSKEKERAKFDPDKAKTFSNKHTVTTEGGRVFTVYDVEDTEEGQREVCKALAAHYKMSPWCLSTFTATGEPTQSAKHYWNVYNALPRRIAFENGKPVAFNSDKFNGTDSYTLQDIPVDVIQDPTHLIYKITLVNPNKILLNKLNILEKLELIERDFSTIYDKDLYIYYVTPAGRQLLIKTTPLAWWDMNDMYPQNILSDSIVSNDDRVQTGNPQLPADPENMNDWWQAQQEIWPAEDYYAQDPQEYFYMDVHNTILNIVNDEISSILESRNLVPEGGNLVWYRNMLSQHYIDSANINMLLADEIVPYEHATTYEIAQAIIAEYNIFDNIRSTIEQEIENLPQPAAPINPDAYGLYTQLDRYSDEYLLDLINDNLDLVQVETARQILADRQQLREAGDYLPFFITPSGEIYGFVTPDGDIYLDETIISPEHPIHEYTHMWDRTVAEKNSTLWKRGVELMKQIPLWEQIENNPNYGQRWKKMSDMTEDRFEFLVSSEVHSRIVGEEGSKLLDRIAKLKGKRGIVAKLKQWILDFWKDLKSTFSDWSESDIQKLTLDDFNHMTVRDFADGVNFNNTSSNEFKLQLQKLGAELMERCKG